MLNGMEHLGVRQRERMAKCHWWGDAKYPEHVSRGWSPESWAVPLRCTTGRWGWQGWPLITPYFGFTSEGCMLLCRSHLPFLQGKRLKKQREWWRSEQRRELRRGEVKHRYFWWDTSSGVMPWHGLVGLQPTHCVLPCLQSLSGSYQHSTHVLCRV